MFNMCVKKKTNAHNFNIQERVAFIEKSKEILICKVVTRVVTTLCQTDRSQTGFSFSVKLSS
jgi:hypothetical protein